MRQGKVYYKDQLAGIIKETNDGEYIYQYNDQFVKNHPHDFISFTMPVTDKPYKENRLFPFFDGLIPEGWLLDIAADNWKINKNDRMGLLLACCKNCIGAVSVEPVTQINEE